MKRTLLIIGLILCQGLSAQIRTGDRLPSITLKDGNDQEVLVSIPEQHYLLIDFWASWCAPCRLANRELVKLSEKYSAQDLKIVAISLDTDKAKWLKAVEKDRINYLQLSDPEGFDAKTALMFGVEQLPASFLFDPSGVLIAINSTPEQIVNYLNLK